MNVFTVSVTAASLLPEPLKIFHLCWLSHSFFFQISSLSCPSSPRPSQICHHLGTIFLMTFMTSEYLPSRCWSGRICLAPGLSGIPPGELGIIHNNSGQQLIFKVTEFCLFWRCLISKEVDWTQSLGFRLIHCLRPVSPIVSADGEMGKSLDHPGD